MTLQTEKNVTERIVNNFTHEGRALQARRFGQLNKSPDNPASEQLTCERAGNRDPCENQTYTTDVAELLLVQPSQPERIDYEYKRVGTANLFVMVERLAGCRYVDVTERRTAQVYARQLQ